MLRKNRTEPSAKPKLAPDGCRLLNACGAVPFTWAVAWSTYHMQSLIRTEPEAYAAIRDNESAIRRLCGAEKVTAGPDVTRPDKAMTAVVSGAEVFLPLEGMIDIEETIARLEKELKKLDYEVERVEKKLSNPGFVQKAPAHIVEEEKRKGEEYREKREKVLSRLQELKG